MQIPLLSDITIIFGLAIVVLLICHGLRIPAIVGFLFTGVIAGPSGLGLIGAAEEVESLSEIGVVLLLFTIGVEFSMGRLLELKRPVLLGGSFQVAFTVALTAAVARHFGLEWNKALFLGFLVSLSSTAIVLKTLQEKSQIETPQGRISLAVLIFQDIAAVPMILLTPFLGGAQGQDLGSSFLALLAKGVVIVVLAILSARWVVPMLLFQVARTRSRELFILTILVLCFAIAWLTSSVGLSLALGAFLAGLIISESDFSYQALGNILPFRDVFTSIFFISVGMLVDLKVLVESFPQIILLGFGILILKSVVVAATVAILRYPIRTMILAGLSLNQIGEFSFLLSKAGMEHRLLAGESYQVLLVVSVLTMALTPFIVASGPKVADFAMRFALIRKVETILRSAGEVRETEGKNIIKDHLLIIGYGVNGRNVARAAKATGIPHMVIEMNPVTVKREKEKGEPITFGDASQEAVLEHAGVEEARIMVVAIPDPIASRMVVAVAKRVNPAIHIIARTRFLNEMQPLYELGANEVIPEEFETSVEIFSRVLARYLVPRDEIERLVAEVRSDGYEMLRTLSQESTSICAAASCDLRSYFPGLEISSFRVMKGSAADGKALAELELRQKHKVTVLAIQRSSDIIANPGAGTVIEAGDVSVLLGKPERLIEAKSLFECKESGTDRSAFAKCSLP